MSEKQTAIAPRVAGTQIEQWGEREIVRELVNRMMMFHPAAKEVGESGMMAAAQLAVMVGASPLPGLNEIHIWQARGKTHVNPGINYYRRRSREVGGGVRWTGQDGKPRPMTLAEKSMYGIPEGQPAGICTGMRADDFDRLWASGVRFPEVEKISSVTGIAIAGPGEAKNGRPAVWTAIKRAETDLLRQLYPNLEQPEDTTELARQAIRRMDGPGTNGPDWDTNVVFFGDQDESAQPIIDADPDTGEVLDPEPDNNGQEPVNGDKHGRPWDAERLRDYMVNRAAKHTGEPTEKQLNGARAALSNVTNKDDDKRHSITAYLFGKESTKDLTSGECSALIAWIDSKPPDWTPSAHAIDEAERVVKARMVELGQEQLL